MNQRRSRRSKRQQQSGSHPKAPPGPPRHKGSTQPNVFFVALVSIVGIMGVICLFGVGYGLYSIREISERQELVRTLPDVTRVAPGETAILDGRIAASVPARYKEFVTYIRESYASVRSGVGWRFVDQARPPLAVETGSGVYTIGNSGYAFDRLLRNWMDAERIDEEPTTWVGAIRIQGIVAQGPVMAVGRLLPEGDQLVFHADSVVGVSRATYADRLEAQRVFEWKFLGGLAVIAALGLYLGWRGVRRVMADA